jgi:ribosomal protein S27AE
MTVACPQCKSPTNLAYEGSHDWTLECGKCDLNLTLYVPHSEEESEIARLTVERLTIQPAREVLQ